MEPAAAYSGEKAATGIAEAPRCRGAFAETFAKRNLFATSVVGKCSFICHKLRLAASLKNKNRSFCIRPQVMQSSV